jgi:chemotaxis protein methyltransferase CheR
MDQKTFDRFRSIVYEKSGIAINDNKVSLVTARVGKRMRALGFDKDKDYLDFVIDDCDGGEMVLLLDAISTNVTHFFRENDHFEFLSELLREWRGQGRKSFKLWSAASSTGEEPYSIAMTAAEALGGEITDVKILATDLSTRVLASCLKGVYPSKQVVHTPPAYLNRYFTRTGSGDGAHYEVIDEIKSMISFTRLNLSETPFPMRGPLDVIFCRNVMIYFDNIVRKRLLDECYRLLAPHGYLFVGHSETLTGVLSDFKSVAPSIYNKG